MTLSRPPQATSAHILTLNGWRGVVFHLAIFMFALAVVIARRPDALFHAQFYAEDGHNWFADAYNYGWWHVLFRPYQGYLHLVPRIAAALALLFPIAQAPLIENLTAIVIQAIPVNLLLSSRSAPWGSFRFRAGLSAVYLFLPNTREIVGTVTESQWIAALIALLLLVALPPRSRAARLFDMVALLLCSLTGPFCLFLFPIAAYLLWRNRHGSWPKVVFGIVSFGCLVQGLSLVLHGGVRDHLALGANPEWLARILAGQVYLGTVLGGNGLAYQLSAMPLVCIAVVGTAVLIVCAATAPFAMRCLIALSCLLFAATLASPLAVPLPGLTPWETLAYCTGAHYWFPLSLAFAWSLVYCVRGPVGVAGGIAVWLLVLMGVGVVRDFRYPPFVDLKPNYAQSMAQLPRGATIIIPINPSGWDMRLVKH